MSKTLALAFLLINGGALHAIPTSLAPEEPNCSGGGCGCDQASVSPLASPSPSPSRPPCPNKEEIFDDCDVIEDAFDEVREVKVITRQEHNENDVMKPLFDIHRHEKNQTVLEALRMRNKDLMGGTEGFQPVLTNSNVLDQDCNDELREDMPEPTPSNSLTPSTSASPSPSHTPQVKRAVFSKKAVDNAIVPEGTPEQLISNVYERIVANPNEPPISEHIEKTMGIGLDASSQSHHNHHNNHHINTPLPQPHNSLKNQSIDEIMHEEIASAMLKMGIAVPAKNNPEQDQPIGIENEELEILSDRPAVSWKEIPKPREGSGMTGASMLITPINGAPSMPEPPIEQSDCRSCPGSPFNTCSQHGECINSECACHVGWKGVMCDSRKCPGKPECSGNGECIDGVCKCDDGFSGSECNVPVCAGSPPCHNHGTCVDKHLCICDPEWKGHDCSQLRCPGSPLECSSRGLCMYGVCYCDRGFHGDACEHVVCAGAPLQCDGKGGCVNGTCYCSAGWKGPDCTERRCGGYEECSANGICVEGLCNCNSGFKGVECEQKQCPGTPLECSNHGTCVDGTCQCNPEWSGEMCEHRLCAGVGGVECSGNGVCVDGNCVCNNGWEGISCDSITCPSHCSSHGICRNGTCECDVMYHGPACNIRWCSKVNDVECGGHGVCSYGHCVCDNQWKGATCQIPTCPGYHPNSPDSECSGHGICRVPEGSTTAVCVCKPDRYGDACESSKCPSRLGIPCSGHGKCDNGTCHCDAGYRGSDCFNKACPGNPECSGRGQCVGGNCVCDPGWNNTDCSTPTLCKPLPACPGTPICGGPHSGVCNERSRTCECLPGWTGIDCTTELTACNGGSFWNDCGLGCAFVCSERCLTELIEGLEYTCGCEDYRSIDHSNCSQKCECPPSAPIWDSTIRQCVTGESCPVTVSKCAMPLRATGMEVDIAVHTTPCIDPDNTHCVCSEGSIDICWKSGIEFAKTMRGSDKISGIAIFPLFGTVQQQQVAVIKRAISTPSDVSGTMTLDLQQKLPEGRYNLRFLVANQDFSDTTYITSAQFHTQNCVSRLQHPCITGSNGHECSNNGLCRDSKCVCNPGWSGDDCSTLQNCPGSLGNGVLCSSHGTCIGCDCVCDQGWTGLDCSLPDCPSKCSGNGACINGVCTCDDGWKGADCSRDTHSDSCPLGSNGLECSNHGFCGVNGACECAVGWKGTACELMQCPGYPHECSGQGTCIDGICHCNAEWSGIRCDFPACPVVNGQTCGGRGSCINGVCQCQSMFYGFDCTQQKCVGTPECSGGNGKCANGHCECIEGWKGIDCSIPACGGVPECSDNGICVNLTCICSPSHIGDKCQRERCPGVPECSDRGTCVSGVCECTQGFHGTSCQHQSCHFGNSLNLDCSGNGICFNGSCICDTHHISEDCSVMSCPVGDNGVMCSDNGVCGDDGVCVCFGAWVGSACSSPRCPLDCSHHGACISGTCHCDPEYSGEFCDIHLTTIPSPSPSPSRSLVAVSNGVMGGDPLQELPLSTPEPSNSPSSSLAVSPSPTVCSGNLVWQPQNVPSFEQHACVPSCGNMISIRTVPYCFPLWRSGCACSSDLPYYDYVTKMCVSSETCQLTECSTHGVREGNLCVCNPGFTGPDCATPQCIGDPPCLGHGTCIDGTCQCVPGYSGIACQEQVCVNGCVNGVCVGGVCVCDVGFQGEKCDQAQCITNEFNQECSGPSNGFCNHQTGKCECAEGKGGADCSVTLCAVSGVENLECGGHGNCVDGTCVCVSPWGGETCDKFLNDCSGNGQLNAQGICQCNNGFEGPDCSHVACPLGSNGEECSAHGSCNRNTGDCECHVGYAGVKCETKLCPMECSNHGTCVDGKCVCSMEWSGIDCAVKSCPSDCSGNGQCIDGTCNCYNGFRGLDCSITQCVGQPLPCSGRGSCHQIENSTLSRCDCDVGFAGDDCSIAVPIHPIRVTDGNGGTVPEYSRCSFPFEYMNKVYHDCTLDWTTEHDQGRPWCSVTENYDEQWGYCAQAGTCGGVNATQCSGHGMCSNHTASGVCDCDDGWLDFDCSKPYRRVTTSTDITLQLITAKISLSPKYSVEWEQKYRTPSQYAISEALSINVNRISLTVIDTGDVTIKAVVQALSVNEALTIKNQIITITSSSSLITSLSQRGVDTAHTRLLEDITITEDGGKCWMKTAVTQSCDSVMTQWDLRKGVTLDDCFRLCDSNAKCQADGVILYSSNDKGTCVLDSSCNPPSFILYQRREKCTDLESTEFHGRLCHFPFFYRGIEYNDCTSQYSATGREWCSTTEAFEQRWGYCAPKQTCPGKVPCSGHGSCQDFAQCKCDAGWKGLDCSSKVVRVSVGNEAGGVRPGELCVFPFVYENTEYHDCTTAPTHKGLAWCSTTGGNVTIEDKYSWGFCAPPGTCPGDPECSSHGTCSDGVCYCDVGFAGVTCDRVATQADTLTSLFLASGGDTHWINTGGWEHPDTCASLFGVTCQESSVVTIELSGNALDGTLPNDISLLVSLRVLDLSNNRLFGTIPSGVGKLISLETLILSSNRFFGAIPEELSQLTNLKILDLSNNFIHSGSTSMSTVISSMHSLSSFSCDETCVVSQLCEHPKDICQ